MKRKMVAALMLSMLFTLAGCGQMMQNMSSNVTEGPRVEESGVLTGTDETESDGIDFQTQEAAESEVPETEIPELEEAGQAKVSYIDFADIDVCLVEEAKAKAPLAFSLVSKQQNGISQVQDWFQENDLFLPMLSKEWAKYIEPDESMPVVNTELNLGNNVFYDDAYIYEWTAEELNIYDKNMGRLVHTIGYQMDKWYLMANCAYLRDGILYLGYLYNGYAEPGTCCLLAYDLENEAVIWRSEDQTYNSMNFIIKEDIIICGYGFTDEKDYIYQIDMNTGKVISKTEVEKMPDLLVEKNGQLYVHTYNYDYVFDLN